MSELFTIPEQLSPRLAWMKRYEISTVDVGHSWEAWGWFPVLDDPIILTRYWIGHGNTDGEALADLAKQAGIKLWNEEGA